MGTNAISSVIVVNFFVLPFRKFLFLSFNSKSVIGHYIYCINMKDFFTGVLSVC